ISVHVPVPQVMLALVNSISAMPLIRKQRTVSVLFIKDPATTEIYTLSLHDALPIYEFNQSRKLIESEMQEQAMLALNSLHLRDGDRKSTRLNSSHVKISYAVFCLKKKKKRNCPLNLQDCKTSTLYHHQSTRDTA